MRLRVKKNIWLPSKWGRRKFTSSICNVSYSSFFKIFSLPGIKSRIYRHWRWIVEGVGGDGIRGDEVSRRSKGGSLRGDGDGIIISGLITIRKIYDNMYTTFSIDVEVDEWGRLRFSMDTLVQNFGGVHKLYLPGSNFHTNELLLANLEISHLINDNKN